MEQLLEIRTVPISLEFRIQDAKLEMSSERPAVDITRQNGSYEIIHQYPKMHRDTTELRHSMHYSTPMRAVADAAEEGMQAGMEATARIAEEGNALLNIQDGVTVASLAQSNEMQRYENCLDCMMVPIPSSPANVEWEPAQLSIRHDADKLAFNWRINNTPNANYIPGKIEFYIKQYPQIEITYLGKPNYVPPSASPDYEVPQWEVSA